jgi:hypothetical protein
VATPTVGLVAVCLLMVSLACGSDSKQVQSTVTDFLEAIDDGDGEKACQQLTQAAQAQLVRITDHTPCSRAAEQAPRAAFGRPLGVNPEEFGLEPVDLCEFDRIRFSDTSGHTATVPCFIVEIPLVESEDGWRISSLNWYLKPL